MIVTVPIRQMRDLTTSSFADLTSKTCILVGFDAEGQSIAQFAVNLTVDEQEAVRRRMQAVTTSDETLRTRADQAVANLVAYEALAAPTNAQTLQVVRLLCRVTRALIRLQFDRIDSTED